MSGYSAGDEELAFSALVSSIGGAPVVEVRGEVDLATMPRLLEAVGLAGSRMDGLPLALVDLRSVRFIDIYATHCLVEEAQAMRELGGELRLVIPEGGPVARAFEVLGVGEMLELYYEISLDGSWAG